MLCLREEAEEVARELSLDNSWWKDWKHPRWYQIASQQGQVFDTG